MLMTKRRLWRTSTVIMSIAVGVVFTAAIPSAAAHGRIQLQSVAIASGGAGLVVTASYNCPGKGLPFGVVAAAQNVGSGRIQTQFEYVETPRCSPGKRVLFATALPPPTQDDNPGDPRFVANAPWRADPLVLSISIDNSGLFRTVTPRVVTISSKSISSTGRLLAHGAGASLVLTTACRQSQSPPGSVFVVLQMTQIIRGAAQTMTIYPSVVCDGRTHRSTVVVPTSGAPWRSGPAFVVISGDISAFGEVRLAP